MNLRMATGEELSHWGRQYGRVGMTGTLSVSITRGASSMKSVFMATPGAKSSTLCQDLKFPT